MIAAVRARTDATRRAELAAMRAKVDIGDAVEAEIALIRSLADRYGFDPDRAEWDAEHGVLSAAPLTLPPQEPPS